MPRRLPQFRMKQNRPVNADDILARVHEFFPPKPFDIVFELRAVRPERIGVRESPVYFTSRKDKSQPFAKGHNFFHKLLIFRAHIFLNINDFYAQFKNSKKYQKNFS